MKNAHQSECWKNVDRVRLARLGFYQTHHDLDTALKFENATHMLIIEHPDRNQRDHTVLSRCSVYPFKNRIMSMVTYMPAHEAEDPAEALDYLENIEPPCNAPFEYGGFVLHNYTTEPDQPEWGVVVETGAEPVTVFRFSNLYGCVDTIDNWNELDKANP